MGRGEETGAAAAFPNMCCGRADRTRSPGSKAVEKQPERRFLGCRKEATRRPDSDVVFADPAVPVQQDPPAVDAPIKPDING